MAQWAQTLAVQAWRPELSVTPMSVWKGGTDPLELPFVLHLHADFWMPAPTLHMSVHTHTQNKE